MIIEKNADTRRRAMKAPISTTFSYIKRKRLGKFQKLHPLNASREIVLREPCNLKLVCMPTQSPNNPLGDPIRHYNYHQNQGHSTEEYFKVRELLEELVPSGALNRLIH